MAAINLYLERESDVQRVDPRWRGRGQAEGPALGPGDGQAPGQGPDVETGPPALPPHSAFPWSPHHHLPLRSFPWPNQLRGRLEHS